MSSSNHSSYVTPAGGNNVSPWLKNQQAWHNASHVPPVNTGHIQGLIQALTNALSQGMDSEVSAPSAGEDTNADHNWIGRLNDLCQGRGVPYPRYIPKALPVDNGVHWRYHCVLPEQLQPDTGCRTYEGVTKAQKQTAKQSAARAALANLV